MDFTLDGEPRPVRRTGKKDSQTYSVDMGVERIDAGKPVVVAYTYRTIANDLDGLLQLRVDQPTRGLAVELDYSDTNIVSVRALDFIAGSRPAQISHSLASVPGKKVSVKFDGWVFARSGVAFLWTEAADGVSPPPN